MSSFSLLGCGYPLADKWIKCKIKNVLTQKNYLIQIKAVSNAIKKIRNNETGLVGGRLYTVGFDGHGAASVCLFLFK